MYLVKDQTVFAPGGQLRFQDIFLLDTGRGSRRCFHIALDNVLNMIAGGLPCPEDPVFRFRAEEQEKQRQHAHAQIQRNIQSLPFLTTGQLSLHGHPAHSFPRRTGFFSAAAKASSPFAASGCYHLLFLFIIV